MFVLFVYFFLQRHCKLKEEDPKEFEGLERKIQAVKDEHMREWVKHADGLFEKYGASMYCQDSKLFNRHKASGYSSFRKEIVDGTIEMRV